MSIVAVVEAKRNLKLNFIESFSFRFASTTANILIYLFFVENAPHTYFYESWLFPKNMTFNPIFYSY